MEKFLLAMLMTLLSVLGISAKDYYASPTGTGDGSSQTSKSKDVKALIEKLQAGDCLYMDGGTYNLSQKIEVRNCGTKNARIRVFASGTGGRPVLNFAGQPRSSSTVASTQRGIEVYIGADYWHFRGFDITKAADNGMKLEGSYCVVELCNFYENEDTGLQQGFGKGSNGENTRNQQLLYGRYNIIVNCDSYNNHDPWTGGGNADGFAIKLFPGPGNEFHGCRAWYNSDDAWDLYYTVFPILVDNCWALKSGWDKGNGNGFKMGGCKQGGTSTGAHIFRNCVSAYNKVKGYDQNHHMEGSYIINCTAYANGVNYGYNMEKPDYGNWTLYNCIGANPVTRNHQFSQEPAGDHNSWNIVGCSPISERNAYNGVKAGSASAYTALHDFSKGDFVDISYETAISARQSDGSLPAKFARLAAGSWAIDKGTPITNFRATDAKKSIYNGTGRTDYSTTFSIAYKGSAPDLGAYEYQGNDNAYDVTQNMPSNDGSVAENIPTVDPTPSTPTTQKSSDASATFTLAGQSVTFSSNAYTKNITADDATLLFAVSVSPATGATVSATGAAGSGTSYTISAPAAGKTATAKFTVTAENGTSTKTYTINIVRAAATQQGGGSATPTGEADFLCFSGSIAGSGIFTASGSTASISTYKNRADSYKTYTSGTSLMMKFESSAGTVSFTPASDGVVKIGLASSSTVYDCKLNGTKLTADATTKVITAEVAAGTQYTIAKASSNVALCYVSVEYVGSGSGSGTVTPPSTDPAKSAECSATFVVDGHGVSLSNNAYTLNVAADATATSYSVALTPSTGSTVSAQGATGSGTSYTIAAPAAGQSASATFTVTAENGTDSRTYTITIAKAAAQQPSQPSTDQGASQLGDAGVTTCTDDARGWFEAAYLKWKPVSGAADYHVYVKPNGGQYTKIDDELVRKYNGYYRADAVGLRAGTYSMKAVPVNSQGQEFSGAVEATGLTVSSYDRSGFAHAKTDANTIGGYNDDGTLRTGAKVIYVTANNAKTVSATVGGKQYTGFQNIVYGYQKGTDQTPCVFRIIGTIKAADMDAFGSSSEGLQVKGSSTYTSLPLTFEGIGEDATIHGFGFLVRNCKNVEFRNFAIMNCMDDALSFDTGNSNCWVHNMDLFYGQKGGDADQAKGDGTVDIKGKSKYITVAYNHFFDNGKCSLGGMKSEDNTCWMTYHHNWFDHSDSRHPRIRTAFYHCYNNYYDGNAKYGVGVTMGGSAFVEANYFRNCKYPMLISLQGTDAEGDGTFSGEAGGVNKGYANIFAGAKAIKAYSTKTSADNWDYYDAKTRGENVSATCKSGTGYNNAADAAARAACPNVDAAAQVPTIVKGWLGAGRINHGDFHWAFANSQDQNYAVITDLQNALYAYKSTLVGFANGTSIKNGGATTTVDGGDGKGQQQEVVTPSQDPTDTPTEDPTDVPTASKDNSASFTVDGEDVLTTGTATINLAYDHTAPVVFVVTPAAKATIDGINGVTGSGNTYNAAAPAEGATNKATFTIKAENGDIKVYTFSIVRAKQQQTSGTVTTSGEFLYFPAGQKDYNAFYSVTGNTSNSKGTCADYLAYQNCDYSLKMESSTNITFTAASAGTVKIGMSTSQSTKDVKFDGVQQTAASDGVITLDNVAAGKHTITKAGTGALCYISLEYGQAVEQPAVQKSSDASAVFTINGKAVNMGQDNYYTINLAADNTAATTVSVAPAAKATLTTDGGTTIAAPAQGQTAAAEYVITAEDGTKRTYTIYVARAAAATTDPTPSTPAQNPTAGQTVGSRNFAIDGFAAYAGTPGTNWYHAGGTTGGQGGQVVVAHNFPEVQAYLQSSKPYVVLVDASTSNNVINTGLPVNVDDLSTGHIVDNGGVATTYGERVMIASNKTLIGLNNNGVAPLFERITFVIQSQSNIIIRNCRFTMKGAPILKTGENKIVALRDGQQVEVGDPDCIGIQADKVSAKTNFGSHIWIDHCEFFNGGAANKDRYDGLLDCKNNVQWLTFSYNYFHDHDKSCLWGKGDTDVYDGCRTISAHHNWFQNIEGSRLPLQRGGNVHYMNNYQENCQDGWDLRTKSVGYADACYFKGGKAPILPDGGGELTLATDEGYKIVYDGSTRRVTGSNVVEKNCTKLDAEFPQATYAKGTWKPVQTISSYTVNNRDKSEDVPTIVSQWSGTGKLDFNAMYPAGDDPEDLDAARETQITAPCYDASGNQTAGTNSDEPAQPDVTPATPKSNNATATVTVNGGSSLTLDLAADTQDISYAVVVAPATGATISAVSGMTGAAGQYTIDVPAAGEVAIATVAITAEDGVTTQNYTITITRAAAQGDSQTAPVTPPSTVEGGDYTLSQETYTSVGSDSKQWNFDGKYAITNTAGKSFTNGLTGTGTFKCANGTQYTIVLPAGVEVTKATFTGYTNSTSTAASYLSEVNGTAPTKTIFNKKGGEMTQQTVQFANNVSGQLTFTFAGKETATTVTLTTAATGHQFVISECGMTTLYVDHAYTMPEGVQGYFVMQKQGNTGLEYVQKYPSGSVVPALTPLALRGAVGAHAYQTTTATGATYTGNMLYGHLDEGLVPAVSGDVKYYKLTASGQWAWGEQTGGRFKSKANKCYLALPAGTAARFVIDFDGATAIDAIGAAAAGDDNVYDINGTRVDTPAQQGIYITRGQKFAK